MVDALHGFALQEAFDPAVSDPAAILVTEDGGRSWGDITPPGARSGAHLLALVASDRLHVWAFHPGSSPNDPGAGVYRSTDAGQTWQLAPVSDVGEDTRLSFVDDRVGYLAGAASAAGSEGVTLYRTTDAGASWQPVSDSANNSHDGTGIPIGCLKSAIGWRDAQTGFIGKSCYGPGSGLLATHDGGVHWSPQSIPLPPNRPQGAGDITIGQPVFFGSRTGYLDAHAFTASLSAELSYLFATHDGGATWSYAQAPATAYDVLAIDSQHDLTILSDGTIETSSDDGHHWTRGAHHPELARQGIPFLPQFPDPQNGFFLVPSFAPSSPAPLYVTDDGGRTLTRRS